MNIDDITEDGLAHLSDDQLFELLKARRLERRQKPVRASNPKSGSERLDRMSKKAEKQAKKVEDLF